MLFLFHCGKCSFLVALISGTDILCFALAVSCSCTKLEPLILRLLPDASHALIGIVILGSKFYLLKNCPHCALALILYGVNLMI